MGLGGQASGTEGCRSPRPQRRNFPSLEPPLCRFPRPPLPPGHCFSPLAMPLSSLGSLRPRLPLLPLLAAARFIPPSATPCPLPPAPSPLPPAPSPCPAPLPRPDSSSVAISGSLGGGMMAFCFITLAAMPIRPPAGIGGREARELHARAQTEPNAKERGLRGLRFDNRGYMPEPIAIGPQCQQIVAEGEGGKPPMGFSETGRGRRGLSHTHTHAHTHTHTCAHTHTHTHTRTHAYIRTRGVPPYSQKMVLDSAGCWKPYATMPSCMAPITMITLGVASQRLEGRRGGEGLLLTFMRRGCTIMTT